MNRRKFIEKTASTMAAVSFAGLTGGFAIKPFTGEMPYRILGKTGLKVSLLGIGGWHIGHGGVSDNEATSIIRSGIDKGINFLDNAWCYHGGRSEERMGNALKDGYRDKVILMTKHHGRDPETAQKHLEDSLRRFHTDVIDVWQFHEIESMEAAEKIQSSGVLDYALKAQQQGKVKYIGFTGHTNPPILKKMLDGGFDWDTVQIPVNLMDYHYLSFSNEIIPILRDKNIGVIAMKALTGTRARILSDNIATLEECFHFVMSLPVSTLISGIDSLEFLNQNTTTTINFKKMDKARMTALLERTLDYAVTGSYEGYKRAI